MSIPTRSLDDTLKAIRIRLDRAEEQASQAWVRSGDPASLHARRHITDAQKELSNLLADRTYRAA